MPFDNTPHVGATYIDGSLNEPIFSSQPKVLVLAPGTSGLSYEVFNVASTGAAEVEFGSSSELAKGMHEVVAQGADNVSLMRIGGKQGKVVLTDSLSATLTIQPESRDDEILERYSLVLEENDDGSLRILIWDIEESAWVYDSSEILVLNGDDLSVVNTGLAVFTTVATSLTPEDAIDLASLVTGDFTPSGAPTMTTVVATAGTDGTTPSLVERYAALNTGYFNLDFKDADYVFPKGVFINDSNVADSGTPNYFKGVPVQGDSNDSLGYLWQYVYQGKLYTYFVDRSDYFTAEGTAAAATRTVNTNLILTADLTGTGGNSISYVASAAGAAGPTVTITEPSPTSLLISLVDDGSNFTDDAVTAINTALGLFTMSNGQLASSIVTASGGSGAQAIVTVASIALTGGLGGHVLTHEDLTGDTIPAAVSTRFAAAVDAELRECNFAHQLASFCYQASTTWKTMQGAISVKSPTAWSRTDIASWVGTPPTVTKIGLDDAIDSTGDNGTSLFGIKLMAGKAITSNGYRAAMIEAGDSTDGYLYGGLIATKGLSLPNASPDWAYGIEDGDEAVDANGSAVDIGKHIFVTVDWPVHRNAFNGGINYRGSIEGSLLGLLVTMPENLEPIGRDFPLKKITDIPRIHASQRDDLNRFRFVNLRFEEGIGWVFNSVRTAAHKTDSDYTRGSTIRCVNRELGGVRDIAKNYLGKPFSSTRLANLQSDIDSFLTAERGLGFNEGARAVLSFTRSDKILGKLTVKLQMVPPFTIELIVTEMSLAAEESELG